MTKTNLAFIIRVSNMESSDMYDSYVDLDALEEGLEDLLIDQLHHFADIAMLEDGGSTPS